MQASVQIELGCGLKFSIEHEVKDLADFRKLLKKADAKLATCVKAMPELGFEKLAKARIYVEQPKQAAAAS